MLQCSKQSQNWSTPSMDSSVRDVAWQNLGAFGLFGTISATLLASTCLASCLAWRNSSKHSQVTCGLCVLLWHFLPRKISHDAEKGEENKAETNSFIEFSHIPQFEMLGFSVLCSSSTQTFLAALKAHRSCLMVESTPFLCLGCLWTRLLQCFISSQQKRVSCFKFL